MKRKTKICSTKQKAKTKTKLNTRPDKSVVDRAAQASIWSYKRDGNLVAGGNQMLNSKQLKQTVGQGFLVFKNTGSPSYAKTIGSRMVNKRSGK